MKNLPKYVLYGTSFLGVLASVLVFATGDYDTILYISYLLTIVGVLLAILSGIYSATQKPGSLKEMGIGLGVFIVIALISYLFSSDEVLPMYGNISAGEARFVDVQLISMYLLCIASVGAIGYSSVAKYFK